MVEDCLGCKIAKKETACPGGVIFETNNFMINQDYEIPIESFFIIGSEKQVKSVAVFSSDEIEQLAKSVHKVRRSLWELLGIEITYLFQDENAPYFNIRIFPKLRWMNKTGEGIKNTHSIIEYAKKDPARKKDIIEKINIIRRALINGK